LANAIKQEFNIEPELIKSKGGVFEVVADGELIFSKKQLKRHAEIDEVLEKLREQN